MKPLCRRGIFAILIITMIVVNGCSESSPRTIARSVYGSSQLITDMARVGDRLFAAGEYGRILVSENDGRDWTPVSTPTTALLTAVFFLNEQHGWAVGHDMTILHTEDGGKHWELQFQSEEEARPLFDVRFIDPDRGLAVGAFGAMLITSDGGRHWKNIQNEKNDRHLNAVIELADSSLLVVGESGTVLRSHDLQNWSAIEVPYQGSLFGALETPQGVWLLHGLRGTVLRSDDQGQHWSLFQVQPNIPLYTNALTETGTILLAGATGTILVSQNAGQSFSVKGKYGTETLSSLLPLDKDTILLAGVHGIHSFLLQQHD